MPLVLIASDNKNDRRRVVYGGKIAGSSSGPVPEGSYGPMTLSVPGDDTPAYPHPGPLAFVIYGSLGSFKCDDSNKSDEDKKKMKDKNLGEDRLMKLLKNHASVDKKYVDMLFTTAKHHRPHICEIAKMLHERGMEVPEFMLQVVRDDKVDLGPSKPVEKAKSVDGKVDQSAAEKPANTDNGNAEPTQDGTHRASSAEKPRSSSPTAKDGKKRELTSGATRRARKTFNRP